MTDHNNTQLTVENSIQEAEESENGIYFQLSETAMKSLQKHSEEAMANKEQSFEKSEDTNLELIDEIEFVNGNNTLKIKLRRKSNNRMFRIQIFLNEDTEVRPVTYTGSRTAYSFWDLLKGAIKK